MPNDESAPGRGGGHVGVPPGTLGPGPESILGLFGDWHVAGIAGSLVALYALGLTGLTACASDLPPVVLAVAAAACPGRGSPPSPEVRPASLLAGFRWCSSQRTDSSGKRGGTIGRLRLRVGGRA